MNWVATGLFASAAVLASATSSLADNCVPCGGCSDPCANSSMMVSSGCGGVVSANPCSVGASSTSLGASLGCAEPNQMVFGGEIVGEQSLDGSEFMSAESLSEPVKMYKVVLEPKYVTESQAVCVNKTRTETRFRTKTTYQSVPITETRYRSKVTQVPKTETKTVHYSVLVPKKTEKTVTLTETVPVWKEVTEQYTVRVPQLIDAPEQYSVKVAKLQDESFTYTVNVPHAVSEQRMHLVTNAIPVTKTRTIQICVPTTKMQTVTKDYGHWEDRVVEVPAAAPVQTVSCGGCAPAASSCGVSSPCTGSIGCGQASYTSCGGCGSSASYASASYASAGCGSGGCGPVASGCGSYDAGVSAGCGTTTTTQKVWVPNVKTEQVAVSTSTYRDQPMLYTVYEQHTTEVPYECTRLVYRAEQRTGTKKTVVYVDEQRTRMRKIVKYVDEPRTRTRKELTYKTVTRTEKIPHVSYTSEPRTKEVSFTINVPQYTQEPYEVTRYERVAHEEAEEYTVTVPYMEVEERKVQVCKMVPRIVEESMPPCAAGNVSAGESACGGVSDDATGEQVISLGASADCSCDGVTNL